MSQQHDSKQGFIVVPSVTNDGEGASFFSQRQIELNGDSQRCLSEQIPALNFRLRTSPSDYASGFHVAGDSTLLIILDGQFLLRLRDGSERVFSAGEMFIAEDYLVSGVDFDDARHGHQGEVVGDCMLKALHLKLAKR